ncbi:MAG: Hpt domain-containing protein [Planctomycetota bacterium]|jgi:HPt (histidine-containing phosphotransfer) domain-containing protein
MVRLLLDDEAYQKTQVMVVTAAGSGSPGVEEVRALGVESIIYKPFQVEAFVEAVAAVLESSPESGRPTATSGDAVLFDRAEALEGLGGSQALLAQVVETLCCDLPLMLEALECSLEQGDLEEAVRHAHSIKGAAANLAGHRVQRAALMVEVAARAGNPGDAHHHLVGLREACTAFLARLQEE